MQKWSHSLDTTVRVCRRKAFLTARYACHSSTKGTARHEAFLLKQAGDPNNWRGRLVHIVINEKIIPVLQQSRWPDFADVRKFASDLLDRQVAFSKAGLYRTTSKTKAGNDYCVLRADLRGDGLGADVIERVRNETLHSLNTLEERHGEILERVGGAKWVLTDKEKQGEIRFRLDDKILVEAKPDLIFCERNNRVVIVDWKAVESTNRNARSQLHLYAFAVLSCGRWPTLRAENLELIEANLLNGMAREFSITEGDLDLIDDRIFTGAELLRPIFERPASACCPEDFAPADSPNACLFCPVLEICNGKVLSPQKESGPVLFELIPA